MGTEKENLAAKVYALVRQVPEGKVCTYGLLAVMLEKPRAARVIGNILSHCPEGESAPCHRIVKHDGSLCGSESFRLIQFELLRGEGAPFLPDGRVDLKVCCWYG